MVAQIAMEQFTRFVCMADFYLMQRSGILVHRRFPELLRVHFTKAFVALNADPLLAQFHDFVDQLDGSGNSDFFLLRMECRIPAIEAL